MVTAGSMGDMTSRISVPRGVAHAAAAPEAVNAATLRTRTVHAGVDATPPVWPLSEPIAPGTAYAFRDPALADLRSAADPPEPNYGRDGLPNVRTLERAVADLEGAEDAHAVASGMAAIALIFLAHLHAGEHVVAFSDTYCEARTLLTEELPRFGVRTTIIDAGDPLALPAAVCPDTRIVFVETIANPSLRLADLDRVAMVTRRHGVLLCVDNTFATPMLCRPLAHGADLVLHSATKFLGGHHDLIAGIVAGRRGLIAPIRRYGRLYGMTLGAMDAWLALRGLHTLAPRIAWMSDTAHAVAAFLQAHPAVAAVRYPGLPDHPQEELARGLLPNGAGAVLTFTLRGGPSAAAALIRTLRMIPYALSLGGTASTVCYPPSNQGDNRDGNDPAAAGSATIRMSIGLETADDLIADLAQALAALPTTEVV